MAEEVRLAGFAWLAVVVTALNSCGMSHDLDAQTKAQAETNKTLRSINDNLTTIAATLKEQRTEGIALKDRQFSLSLDFDAAREAQSKQNERVTAALEQLSRGMTRLAVETAHNSQYYQQSTAAGGNGGMNTAATGGNSTNSAIATHP